MPVDPLTLRTRTIEAIARALEGAPPAAPEDRLMQAIIETRQIAWAVRRLAPELHPRLEGPAGELADRLDAALAATFPGAA